MKHIYTSIDVGSNNIKIVVCELFQNKLNLLASVSSKSKGIRKGVIVDEDLATASIKNAFMQIEETLGIKIKKVIASVPCFNAEYSVVKGNIKIESEDKIITVEDINRVINNSVKNNSYTLREVVTVLPVDYLIDNETYTKKPLGRQAETLGCRAVLVTTPKKNVYSIVSILEKLEIEVVDISLNNIGDLYSFNNKEFENEIGAIINIGSDITSVSLYNKSILVKSSIINQGGKDIDNDISYTYKVDIPTAKKLKVNFALAHTKNSSENDIVEVKSAYDDNLKINQYEISKIAMAKIGEILNNAKKEIMLLTTRKIDYIIITGGTSNMTGFEYVVKDVFGENALIGNVKMLGIRDNRYSSVIGNIVYFISKLKLKNKDYSMISDDEMYQVTSVTSKNLGASDSMLGKIFGFFFSE